ncbi:SusC/RagA family TonB-linked outer membrane protein [Labilibaculum euxinus]
MEKRFTRYWFPLGSSTKTLLRLTLTNLFVFATMLTGWADDHNPQGEGYQLLSDNNKPSLYENSSLEVQKKKEIKGSVKDKSGMGIPGVNVFVKGTFIGVTTDINGYYAISVPAESELLVYSFVGMLEKEMAIGNKLTIDVVMEESSIDLDEVVAIAYGSQKKTTITGAVSTVSGEQLLKTPTGSLSNALSGSVTGLSSVQYSGEPGADDAEIYIRGVTTLNNSSPLIQVDGVEREFSQLDPNEIESITILKDASATAVFGVRGANGVILITTKRGKEGKAKISFSSSTGYQMPTKLLEFADSYEYASYYNEAQANDGVSAGSYKFQPDVLEAFKTHSDPILYPDVDWLDQLLKKGAIQTQHNVNISGGAEKIRYFVSLGAFTQEGLFKTFDSGYDFNFDFKRYNYRANLDYDISESTLLTLNLGGRIEDKNTPISNEDQNQLFRQLYWATPFGGAGIVDGKRVVTNTDYLPDAGSDGLSPYYGKGFNAKSTNVLNVDLALKQELDFVTEGLFFKVKGSYNSTFYHTKTRSSSTPFYTPIKTSDGGIEYKKSGDDAELNYGESFDKGRNWYAEASINYDRKYGKHTIGALALYTQSKKYYPKQYTDIPSGYVGMVGRITYDWSTRYMAEFNVGYNGSENFARAKRYGFFPAGSLAWVVSEENFMKEFKNVINYMKLRGSYGVVGNDKYYVGNTQQRFMYIPDSYVLGGSGYNFGTNVGSNQPGAYESSKSNKDVTWEKAYKQNYGIDLAFLKERFKVSVDVFSEHREDILVKSETTPNIVGVSLPVINMGVVDSHGYEIALKWSDEIGENFKYWVNTNLSFAKNKIIEKGEVKPNEDYMWQTGRPVGSNIIRKFWGFYDETANDRYKAQYGQDIAVHAGGLEPGDVVYVDLNRDGTIDSDDVTKAGYTNNPEYVAGMNLGFSWKNLDFSMQWTGAWNTSRLLQETFRNPMGDTNTKGLLSYQYKQRWTPETASTAKLPRATLAHKTNNYQSSDLFLVDASYLRLKNIEIGYKLNLPVFQRAGIDNCRLYLSGYNLLTFSKFKLGDPESKTSSRPAYPLTRVINLGLKLAF